MRKKTSPTPPKKESSSSSTPTTIRNKEKATMAGAETVMEGRLDEFAKQAKKMVNNKEFSDLKFLIGPGRKAIHAHRCILSARCAVFKAMFADKASGAHDKDVPLVLSDMSPEIFLSMLEFIYTNTVTLSSKTAIDVLATSLEYGLDDLRDLCVDYMDANLTVTNACDVMQAAVTYNQNDLKEKTIQFIEDNSVEVFKSKGFQEISEDTLVSILRSSRLNMDEMDLYRAVKEWATVNSALNQITMQTEGEPIVVNGRKVNEIAREAIKHIRLPLLTAEELTSIEDESKKDNFMPVALFAYAWKLHALKTSDKENIQSIRRRGTTPREHHKFFTDQNAKAYSSQNFFNGQGNRSFNCRSQNSTVKQNEEKTESQRMYLDTLQSRKCIRAANRVIFYHDI